ncbi:MAG TPA: PadR family transcriptional regulator [Acidimicrobiales bacterium]|nr:PadR family transcriptional regulator [Acidimicrobiales bacterium]
MTRLFRRGELKAALLDALGASGPANGYTIMQTLADQIGQSWQPSPGAVYPALLALEDTGLVSAIDQNGSRVYELTPAGKRAATKLHGTVDAVAQRARTALPAGTTLGSLLDGFATSIDGRQRHLDAHDERAIAAVLDSARNNIERLIGKET